MKYSLVADLVFNQPWAILPSKFSAITDFLAVKVVGGDISDDDIQAILAAAPTGAPRQGAVAVLPLHGVMSQRMNMLQAMSGGTSTEMFGKQFRDAMNDPNISGVVIDIDSPGGSVFGVAELWATVRASRGIKPIVAFANSMAASAAYWVATAADEIVVTPGGEVGSIGVLTGHADISKQLEMEGEKVTLISAGKKKVDGNPFEPLSDEARADIQARVDDYYESFVSAVAQGRGATVAAVKRGFGEGAMVGAEEAVALKMADRVGTLETAVIAAANGGRVRAESDVIVSVEAVELLNDTDLRARMLELEELR